jgi:hypothetical protein
LQLLSLDHQPGDKHQKDYAKLGQFKHGRFQVLVGHEGRMHDVEHGWPQQQAGDQFTQDRRLSQACARQTSQFGRTDQDRHDQCKLEKIRHPCSSFTAPRAERVACFLCVVALIGQVHICTCSTVESAHKKEASQYL